MKTASLVSLIVAAVCLVLAFIGARVIDGAIVFPLSYYFAGAEIALLASIAFAAHHLIGLKEK